MSVMSRYHHSRPLGLVIIAILGSVLGFQSAASANSAAIWEQQVQASRPAVRGIAEQTKQQLKQTPAPAASAQVQQVSTEMLNQISVLQDFVLQNPNIFEIRDPSVFENRDPAVIARLATPVRALDDLQLLARAFRSPEHTAEGVTLLTALNDSLAAFPQFVRSSQFITAYRQLNAGDQTVVAGAVKELAEVLKVMRGIAVTELGGDFGPSQRVATELEADNRRVRGRDGLNWRMRDEEDMNWRN